MKERQAYTNDKVTIAARVPRPLRSEIDELSAEKNRTVSAIIAEALRMYIKSHEKTAS